MQSEVIVVGLDGATFDLIGPLAERGELPNFARLLAEGAWAPLSSTVPPVSPQAWSSFLTGVHPGQHGVFGFLGQPEGRYYRRPIRSARDMQAPTLLQIAGEAGRRVAALGIPMTYPPAPVNGVLVPEQQGPPLSTPPALWQEMVAAVGDPRDQATHIRYAFTEDKRGYVARQRELIDVQRRAAHWLLDRERYDLFIVVWTALDRMGHFLWRYGDPTHPAHRPEWAAALGSALEDAYRQLDAALGELWERLAPGGTLMVMSDHGFGPLHRRFHANLWLREHGLLALRPLAFRLASVRYPMPVLRGWNAFARRTGLPHAAIPFENWQKPIARHLYDPRPFISSSMLIDWPRTRVYSGAADEHGIRINLRGREPLGIVSPGAEYERLRRQVQEELLAFPDPRDGQPLLRAVRLREEVYSGPYIERAPDLVIEMREPTCAPTSELFAPAIVHQSVRGSGTHRPEGICLLAGPHVLPGARLAQPAIVDLAPTLLHLLGVPTPAAMEGRVLHEAFEPDWWAAHPETRVSYAGEVEPSAEAGLTREEAARVEAHLRGLGYIG